MLLKKAMTPWRIHIGADFLVELVGHMGNMLEQFVPEGQERTHAEAICEGLSPMGGNTC